MSVYQVTGRMEYRGHQPGERFEAVLDRLVEARALARGNIIIVSHEPTTIAPGSFTFPREVPFDG